MGAGVQYFFALVSLGLWLGCECQVPRSPCPKLFKYLQSETRDIVGVLKFRNDLSGEYTLTVNMSIQMDTDKNIKIIQRTPTWQIQNGADIEFHVQFPFNHTFPQLTAVNFNNKLYCVGPPAEGRRVTALGDKLVVSAKTVDGAQAGAVFPEEKPSTPEPAPPAPATPAPVAPAPTPAPAPPPTPAPAPKPQAPAKTSNVMIQINLNKFPDDCGINVDYQPFILEGNTTRDGEYPWLVALFVYSNFLYNFKCAGSLITDKHVVTAAHCVKDLNGAKTNIEDMLVVMGTHSIKNWARKGVTRGVKRCVTHREYVKPAEADIALITLEEPIQFTLTIKPICLWSESDKLDQIVGDTGVVAGWGRDEEENTFLTEPRQLTMPIVSQEACLRSDERFFKLTTERTFCAGELKGSTPCTGDSGGGFIMKRNRRWTLRGIVSVGLLRPGSQVCDGRKYTVFSDVTKFHDWLKDQIEKS